MSSETQDKVSHVSRYISFARTIYICYSNVVSEQVRGVRAQKMARGWKFWILTVEELY